MKRKRSNPDELQQMNAQQKMRPSDRCIFYNNKKRRHCNQIKITNSDYCLYHSSKDTLDQYYANKGKRIPCPLDPSHTIYEDKLEQHLKKCTKLKELKVQKEPYYQHCLNSGSRTLFSNGFILTLDPKDQEKLMQQPVYKQYYNKNTSEEVERQKKLVTKSQEKKKKSSSPLNYLEKHYTPLEWQNKMKALLNTFEKILKDYGMDDIKERILFHKELKDQYDEKNVALNKHLSQQASIIGQLEHHKCHDINCGYVELGCGKADLSYMVYAAMKKHKEGELPRPIDYLLVDRSAFKIKKETQMRYSHPQLSKKDKETASSSLCQRIRIDIRHFKMDGLKQYQHPKKNSVITSKHLCGVATDLSLSCLNEWGKGCARGIFIALCCHYLCSWEDYVNHAFLEKYGWGHPKDFELLRSCTSWALTNSDSNVKSSPYMEGLDAESRRILGWKCKRILDLGRMAFLIDNGYNATLIRYIDRSISPENVMLIAVPKH